jgi:hypothetical protein
MTNVMAYFAARSLRGVHKALAEDGVVTPVLRPRLPSRYETMAPLEAGATGDIAGEDAFFEPEPLPRRRPPTAEPAPTAAPAIFAAPVPPAAASVPQATATTPPAGAPPASALRSLRADRERGPDHLALSLSQPAAAAANAIAAPPLSPQPIPSAGPPAVRAEPRSAAVAGQPPPPIPPAIGEAPYRSADSKPIGGIAPASPPPSTPVPAAVVTPLRESRLARPAVAPPRLGDVSQPPTRPRDTVIEKPPAAPRVEVTIGRIEIRAASIPAPPRTAPRAPPMSLDDYLAKRARG